MPDTNASNRIAFRFLPNLPIDTRFTVVAVLIIAGFGIQFVASVFVGWLVLFAGCMLGMIKGRTTKPEITESGQWQTTTIEELQGIEQLCERIRSWRGLTDTFRPGSGIGCAMTGLAVLTLIASTSFVAVAVDRVQDGDPLANAGKVFAPPLKGGLVFPVWFVDFLTMLLPIWFAGSLSAWEPPQLPRKARHLLHIYGAYESDPTLEFLPSLYVSGEGEHTVPMDARLLVKLKDAPEDFMGIQVQVSMNDVQGTKYPYCYSVIIARKEYGLADKAAPHLEEAPGAGLARLLMSKSQRKELDFQQYGGSIVEVSSESDVDVLVVRQITTGKGYHTNEEQACAVFANALNLTRAIVQKV